MNFDWQPTGEDSNDQRTHPHLRDLKSKVKQLMEYAGWQEGRKVDISIAEKYSPIMVSL